MKKRSITHARDKKHLAPSACTGIVAVYLCVNKTAEFSKDLRAET